MHKDHKQKSHTHTHTHTLFLPVISLSAEEKRGSAPLRDTEEWVDDTEEEAKEGEEDVMDDSERAVDSVEEGKTRSPMEDATVKEQWSIPRHLSPSLYRGVLPYESELWNGHSQIIALVKQE